MGKKFFGIKLFSALAVMIMFLAVPATSQAQTKDKSDDIAATTLIHKGDKAPDFTVEMVDGSKITLSELKGKVNAKGIALNRKVMADLATNEPKAFEAIVNAVK